MATMQSLAKTGNHSFGVVLFSFGCFGGSVTVAEKALKPVPVHIGASDSSLDVGDIFEVRVFGENELTNRYRVNADGTINFPLIGTIRVAGLQPSQIGALITERLKQGILKEPQVTIFVQEQNSKKVIVTGQVTKPGTFLYTPGMTLIEVITLAGGFSAVAARNSTTVTRIVNGKEVTFQVKAGDISDGSGGNFSVKPGDIVSVPERFF